MLGLESIPKTIEKGFGAYELNNRAVVLILLTKLQQLLQDRVEIEVKDTSAASKIKQALWHDKLVEINSNYDFNLFVTTAMKLPEDHPN